MAVRKGSHIDDIVKPISSEGLKTDVILQLFNDVRLISGLISESHHDFTLQKDIEGAAKGFSIDHHFVPLLYLFSKVQVVPEEIFRFEGLVFQFVCEVSVDAESHLILEGLESDVGAHELGDDEAILRDPILLLLVQGLQHID